MVKIASAAKMNVQLLRSMIKELAPGETIDPEVGMAVVEQIEVFLLIT